MVSGQGLATGKSRDERRDWRSSRSESEICSRRGRIYTDNPITVNRTSELRGTNVHVRKPLSGAAKKYQPEASATIQSTDLSGGGLLPSRRVELVSDDYLAFNSSTSKSKVALGGMTRPAPRSP